MRKEERVIDATVRIKCVEVVCKGEVKGSEVVFTSEGSGFGEVAIKVGKKTYLVGLSELEATIKAIRVIDFSDS